MTPERIEDLRNEVGLSPDEASEALDALEASQARVAELLAALREACIAHHSANGTKPPESWLLAIAKAEGRR